MMENKVFGTLDYDYGWNGKATLSFFGRDTKIELIIQEDEDAEFTELQYESYEKFLEEWENIESDVLEAILDYYNELREELGYDDDSNEDYPEISEVDELEDALSLDAIIIPPSDIYDERCICLAFSCSWDEENGVGVRLIEEEIDEVGQQDIAF